MVVGDDDQSIYRFRGASFAAFVEFDRRFGGAARARPDRAARRARPRACDSRRTSARSSNVLTVANRLIERNELRYAPDKALRPTRRIGRAGRARRRVRRRGRGPPDRRPHQGLRRAGSRAADRRGHGARLVGVRGPLPQAPPPRGDRRAATRGGHPVQRRRRAVALRDAGDPRPRAEPAGDRDPLDDVALTRMMSAAPWRLDAIELLRVSRMAHYDRRHLAEVVARDRRDRRGRGRPGAPSGRWHVPSEHGRCVRRGGRSRGPPGRAGPAGLARCPTSRWRPIRWRPSRETRRIDVAPETRAKLRRLAADARCAGAPDVARRPVHAARGVRREHGRRLRPARARLARGEADGRQHRQLHAIRAGLAGRAPDRHAGRVRRLPRRLPRRRRRAAHERRGERRSSSASSS